MLSLFICAIIKTYKKFNEFLHKSHLRIGHFKIQLMIGRERSKKLLCTMFFFLACVIAAMRQIAASSA